MKSFWKIEEKQQRKRVYIKITGHRSSGMLFFGRNVLRKHGTKPLKFPDNECMYLAL
jgi:hypothetical protein